MTVALKAKTHQVKKNIKKIPDYLIRETMDGQPLYYRGYRDVLRKLKTIEDIMPCSTLQATLDFGVKKVFWITSSTQKVMLAEQGKDWLTIDWNKDIEIQDGVFFNVGKYLQERGIDVTITDSSV